MLKETIHTFEDLDKWLSDNYYFEDGHVLAVHECPLEIIIGYNVKASYEANSERYILSFKLIPSNIIEWTFKEENIPIGEDNYISYIEAIETEKGICLEFSTPATFRLTSDNITIEEQELIKTTFKPGTSDTEMFITSELNEIPKPQYWKEKLKEYGHNIAFRYYAGDEKQPEQVPYPDYQGFYIQLPDRISSTREGIFLSHMKLIDGKLNLHFENKDEKLHIVWEDMTRILADLPNAKINSGNCKFTGAEWKQYLKDRILPTG